jgi:hypothetical protein
MNGKGNLTTGILIGVGISAGAYYLYNRNKDRVDGFLRSQGINIPESGEKDYAKMTYEELVSTKEHIEDLIAEIEQKMKEEKKTTQKKKE